MIRSIRGRRAFDRLARDGTRIRRSAVWCSWCPDPESTGTYVAFAIGRAVGPAVARNRIRRRLRHLLAAIDRSAPLPPGLLLVGVRPSAIELTFDQLGRQVESIVAAMRTSPIPADPNA